MYKQLLYGHKACKTTLSLTLISKRKIDKCYKHFDLSLQNCSTVRMVKTGICDVCTNTNTDCAADVYTKFLL